MTITYTLRRAVAARAGLCVEITLEAEDGTAVTFAATPEQADELAEDLEEILDADSGPRRTPLPPN